MLLFMNEEGKGASKSVREEQAQRPMKQEDVEGRGRKREEGRRESTAWEVSPPGCRLGRAAEVTARRPADDNFRVRADQRVRGVAVLEALGRRSTTCTGPCPMALN